jgi:hypothetical protein
MLKKISLFLIVFCSFILAKAQTTIQKTEAGYSLSRNGKPYNIKGVGGEVNFDKMVSIGANSFRTWGVDNATSVLAEANQRGLTVMLGLWLQHERHGFDYNNAAKVKKQFDFFKTVVDRYKNSPALLVWGIGNELDLDYTNPNVWYAVQDLAKYIHEVDPNHPTSTVTAGLDSLEVQYIKSRCPDIDIYCVNTYGDIGNVPKNIAKYGWTGPYMITEWGPNGHWESPQTAWGVSIEQTSSEKKEVYYSRYKNYIEPNKNYCLGSYAFLWGAKQEYTETWYGLFTKDNVPTEPIDALEMVFKDSSIINPSPSILRMTLNNKKMSENIEVNAEEKFNAEVLVAVGHDSSVCDIKYIWRIIEESTDKKSGGDVEDAAKEVSTRIKHGCSKNQISLSAPTEQGQYRVFLSAYFNGKIAYANIPFKVIQRSINSKQSKFIKMKYTDMNSFVETK